MLSDDSRQAKAEKIQLLVCLVNFENHQPIFRELIVCLIYSNSDLR